MASERAKLRLPADKQARVSVLVLLFALVMFVMISLLDRLGSDHWVVIRSLSPNATTTVTYGYGSVERREVVRGTWAKRLGAVKPGEVVHIEIEGHSPNDDVTCEIFFEHDRVARERSHDPPSVSCSAVRT